MLSSIHPLGERAKGNRFGATAAAFIVGSVLGGAGIGAAAGLVTAALGGAVPAVASFTGSSGAGLLVGALAVAAAVFETTGWALPSIHRQVDENWLQRYRGWVYGAGFGVQLGAGVATYITSAAVPVALIASFLVGDLAPAVAVMALFGAVRGVSILAARSVDSPARLVALHRGMQRRAPLVASLSAATLALAGFIVGVALLPAVV